MRYRQTDDRQTDTTLYRKRKTSNSLEATSNTCKIVVAYTSDLLTGYGGQQQKYDDYNDRIVEH